MDYYTVVRKRLAEELGVDPGIELQALHQAILRGDLDPVPPMPVPSRAAAVHPPAQLPLDVFGFTGRDDQLASLDRLLDRLLAEPSAQPTAVVISAVSGTAGVGKTVLAVHWAHRVRDRFPDGQLYADLRGYAPGDTVRPLETLTHFLLALGVATDQVPADVDAAAAMYRTTLADRRVLVVLDNVASADQVRPLLPGSPGCLVLVTSRDRLGGLVARDGARRLTLDVLSPDEAHAVLAGALGTDRVSAEPAAASSLARLCAHLPLALRIAAANLSDDPHGSIGDYVDDLVRGNRLAALAIDGDEQAAVRAAFELSQVSLAPAARRLFRLLGLAPGPDLDVAAAAALAGTARAETVSALGRLAGAHLNERRAGDRFAFHDLLRLYAAELSAAEDSAAERRAAIDRLLSYYLRGIDTAARRLYPHVHRLPQAETHGDVPEFADNTAAVAWLDAERANLVSAARDAAEHGPKRAAWLISDGLRGYFWLRRYAVEALAVAEAGLRASRDVDDSAGQATARLSLGQVMRSTARHYEAVEHYREARARSRSAGWLAGEAAALGSLANVYRDLGQLDRAADQYRQVAEMYRVAGSRAGEAVSYANLGNVYIELGRLSGAVDHYRRSLEINIEIGSRIGEALALDGLGTASHLLGHEDEAAGYLTRSLAIHRESGNREGEADALAVLGEVHRSAGRYPRALEYPSAALALARDAGVARVEVDALTGLARTHAALGEPRRAITYFTDAHRLAHQTGYRFGEVAALVGLAAAHFDAGGTTMPGNMPGGAGSGPGRRLSGTRRSCPGSARPGEPGERARG